MLQQLVLLHHPQKLLLRHEVVVFPFGLAGPLGAARAGHDEVEVPAELRQAVYHGVLADATGTADDDYQRARSRDDRVGAEMRPERGLQGPNQFGAVGHVGGRNGHGAVARVGRHWRG